MFIYSLLIFYPKGRPSLLLEVFHRFYAIAIAVLILPSWDYNTS